MMSEKFRVFGVLLYKNFLVRKRMWKMGLFVEIMFPLLVFLSIWGVRNLAAEDPITIPNITYSKERSEIPSGRKQLYVVPDNEYLKSFMKEVQKCFQMRPSDSIISFKTEEEMLQAYDSSESSRHFLNETLMAVVFKNESFDLSTPNLEYKILTTKLLPSTLFKEIVPLAPDVLKRTIAGFQICLDKSFIKTKQNNYNEENPLEIFIQRMPTPAHSSVEFKDSFFRLLFCGFALLAFLTPLCIESSYASDEKFLGINVLMEMNGVSNYLNLVSWLVSGLIFSLFYTIPIIVLLNFSSTEEALPFLYYGNSLIVWLMLTLNVAHLISFGIHVSTYFTRSLFMVTGLMILYVGSSAMQRYGLKESTYSIVPYLGIFFPNILLFRGFSEVNYFEGTTEGIHWSNLFKVQTPSYGTQGSIGVILIFSLLGIIFHLFMANYIYAINPGKYGVKKHPFYFLKRSKSYKCSNDYDKVENLEIDDTSGKPFEPVNEGVYSPGIQMRNLKKMYHISVFSKTKVYALRGISVDFYQGQITALLGHNGAGKTTMMSILTGMINPTEGLVLINGKNVKDKLGELMVDIGLCPQENMLFPNLSIAQQLTFFAMLKNKNKSRKVIETEVKVFLHKLKLFDKRNALPKELSGGQKRLVCLGMAMIGDSNTLILDEPTSGLDPESRRDVWNILLKMKGKKTILISTHDMEEADILGDRIAIVHSGKLRSYGTSMYLKKLLGKGNIEVTLSTEPSCDLDRIVSYLDPQSEIVNTDSSKTVLSIPFSPELPDTLDKIENTKKELGITGMSVSLITLEQVFLKVTRDNDDDTESREPFIHTIEKLKGQELCLHSAKGLLCKKLVYTKNNIMTTITMLMLLFIALLCITFILMDHDAWNKSQEAVHIRLDMYSIPETYYKTDEATKAYGESYKAISEEFHATTFQGVSKRNTASEDLLDIAMQNIVSYNYRLLAGADFRTIVGLSVTAFYNEETALFTLPISINLLTNALLRTIAGPDSRIDASVQQFPEPNNDVKVLLMAYVWNIEAYVVPFIIICLLYPTVALFVVHPIRENLTNVKHLQRMTGVSCFNYWGTMFLFDFVLLAAMSLLFIVGFVIMDAVLGLRIFKALEFVIFTSLFILFAVNILPLVYCVSFWKRSTNAAIKLLSLLPLALVSVELVMNLITLTLQNHDNTMNIIRPIQKGIFLIVPYVSFFHGQISFFQTAKKNANCERLSIILNMTSNNCPIINGGPCCEMKCSKGRCLNPEKYFHDFKNDIALETSLISLFLTSILYFGILITFEYKVIAKFFARCTLRKPKPKQITELLDEQVNKEKHSIAFEICRIKNRLESVSVRKTNGKTENASEETLSIDNDAKNHVLLVYELRKIYGRFVAVRDLSFGVHESQCFGLLGVNGAGKSTSFRMMTGEDIPNHGELYLDNSNIRKNQNHLSQIGYCPQNDAIIKSLNAYDHLYLFARLRGIPEDQVEVEVKKWIDRLHLNACAVQPSGTYSGGNKRRLNIAMALIGVPKLVLMDEPTTGVDPAARRSLWNVIQSCKSTGQAVILTSHSMEECEALCNRLGIMVDGTLVCIGPSQELKQRFGVGYNVQIKLNPEKSKNEVENIKIGIHEALDCEIMDENSGYLMYHVTSTDVTWRQMYDVMSDLKSRYTSIQDFTVLSSTLEQLFLLFARAADRSNERTK